MVKVLNIIFGISCTVLAVTNFIHGNNGVALFDLFVGLGNICCAVMKNE